MPDSSARLCAATNRDGLLQGDDRGEHAAFELAFARLANGVDPESTFPRHGPLDALDDGRHRAAVVLELLSAHRPSTALPLSPSSMIHAFCSGFPASLHGCPPRSRQPCPSLLAQAPSKGGSRTVIARPLACAHPIAAHRAVHFLSHVHLFAEVEQPPCSSHRLKDPPSTFDSV
jgi:hypothetical protein